jgi:hypothetical protein
LVCIARKFSWRHADFEHDTHLKFVFGCDSHCRTHPGDLGHQVIAELLAGLVFQAAERLQVGSDGVSRGAGWAAERTDAGLKGLPPPMIPDNEDAPSTLCAMQAR